MGLFGKKEACPICGNAVKGFVRAKIKDKVSLCGDCTRKMDMELSMHQFQTVEDIKKHLAFREENQQEFSKFVTTNEKRAGSMFIREDANLQKWYVSNQKNPINPTLFGYDEIVDYELIEDGDTVTKGGVSIGRAVVGGALFGGVGAVIGGTTGKKRAKTVIRSMNIRISLNHPYKNKIEIPLNTPGVEIKSGSLSYNLYKSQATDAISFLDGLCSKVNNMPQVNVEQQNSGADEILKYKQLLDSGIITQEEFDAKKKQILGL